MAAIFQRVANQHGGNGKQAEGGQSVHTTYLAVRPPQLAPLSISSQAWDVAYWHETDLPRCPQFGRYRGESGHGGYERRLPSLTRLGHAANSTAAARQRRFWSGTD